jgi:surface protein
MFYGFSGLTELDLAKLDTSNVTNMNAMFAYCSGLTSLNISGFNTFNVTDMGFMFASCESLTTIYAGSGWNLPADAYSEGMFQDCTSLVGSMGTSYDPNHIDKTYAHIDGGPSNPGYFTDKNAALRGDVNGDGKVTIADVTALINYLLSGEPTAGSGDVNGDSKVTIADVTALINQLLSSN